MLYPQLDTPCVLIDEAILEANIRGFQAYCDEQGLRVRPHIKTHKLPWVARKQLDAGAIGITCQKVGEAEVFAAAGFDDILISYNIIGAAKLARLLALAGQVRTLAVVADSEAVLQGLSATFEGTGKTLDVLVECDTGAGRCGVQSPEQAAQLAQLVARLPGLRLRGLMTYPAAYSEAVVQQWFSRAAALCEQQGLALEVFSSGGTPSMWHAHEAPIVNEYRIGTYVYQDRSQVAAGACEADCALTVLTTVVSVPVAGRVIVDAGSKALTSDLLGQDGYGQVVGYPQARVIGLSEEHGVLDFSACSQAPLVAERLRIIPNHACPVSNLFDEVHFCRDGEFRRTEAVLARGKVT
ncbi:alanine racemase [Marinobacterium aestuarii]|uniref:Alanine racemase n=1 Tax=Marinobacterium aestuarii TaxID=1821621 RepID=A0A1A9F3K9_9GAMM|nr:D-TA family PLP-dependent enzyme [Marinobacterium aestuarii]ANG64550.1 alanine racemase [Marinobacterium aestuarii]